jgi:phosphatidylinositol alpha-mannosyltransferase
VSKVAGLAYTLGRPVTRRWIESLDVITAVSPIAARVVDFTHRVRVIPNGIDVDEYAPGAKDPESAVFLGRDDPRKGLAVLLDAWPQVRLHHPAATLTVVGADQRSEPVPGVVFAGRVTESEKRRLLATAAVFCAPNLSGESFGIVVAEGMAAGCAVVASGLPAFARVVGDAGVLVAPGDGEGLAAAITTLLDDPESIATLGAAAREQVRRFDGPVVAAQYVGAYEDAIDLSRTS